ncbi:MAG: DUF3616 domain-containing protein [Xanthobacteraceae bacterium]
MKLRLVIAAATQFLASAAFAQSIAPQPTQWIVAPAFAKSNDARENISGAACAVTQPAYRACLAVNDEKKYAQLFSIDGNTIVPGTVVRLLGDNADGDPDAEGVAYSGGYFYVVGSHGLSRKKGKLQGASFLVFRIPANLKTGGAGEIAPAVQTSSRLRAALRADEHIGPFAERPLSANGANIEGIAVDGGRLYAGLRGPSVGGRAFILSANIGGVFAGGNLGATVHPLALGAGAGIRDLARVSGGLLVLAGPATEEGVPAAVFHWNPASGGLKKLSNLGGTSGKAETLLVLGQTEQNYRVLVMFDGIANGGPTEYLLPR